MNAEAASTGNQHVLNFAERFVAEPQQYQPGVPITRENFTDMVITGYARAHNLYGPQKLVTLWAAAHAGLDLAETSSLFGDFVQHGGWDALSAAEQERILAAMKRVPAHGIPEASTPEDQAYLRQNVAATITANLGGLGDPEELRQCLSDYGTTMDQLADKPWSEFSREVAAIVNRARDPVRAARREIAANAAEGGSSQRPAGSVNLDN